MSRLSSSASKEVVQRKAEISMYEAQAEQNFMGGTSFKVNPLQTLKMVATSSIFGEPQYYRKGIKVEYPSKLSADFIFADLISPNEDAGQVFERVIDNALDYDYLGTLEFAKELRNEYLMRLNPAVIYVRAIRHKNRVEFNAKNPGYMRAFAKEITPRPDDITNQFEYYMYLNGSKKGLPSILKRSWADSLESMSRYQINKYKGKRLIDLVRLSHANNETINELMRTGTVAIKETEQTWEMLKSSGKTWVEILNTIKVPHMALLRNLRGIFSKSELSQDQATQILEQLKAGVLQGKQFPFRYYTAFNIIKSTDIPYKQQILDALEECIDISVANMPKLKGKVACLSDNSGSAWGTFNSEYGKITIADIANLSSVITAKQADNGEVGVFGDRLTMTPISKRNGILSQLTDITEKGKRTGSNTENGLWLFWNAALNEKIHYDTVFIYSDMQAGRGELFGHDELPKEFTYRSSNYSSYLDVLAVIRQYRKTVNPKVNVFSVQVGGYTNSVLPETLYRGAILTGWTGKEAQYADAIIKAWDEIENK